ncbi:hypothetical protein ET475_03435 [Microbacterium protaetiae]|uniref:YbaB/EbfC family DNA-binding protein n=1 Tax=Microbacterium protaetiae TaxID=2509458 RepID=A0A4P6EC03_9MICO|nr:hypothetical protein [Microbacterium protaetiae]QAY59136.1 hypothetical protein ET475_03435 [Microbacterium protaetiae]
MTDDAERFFELRDSFDRDAQLYRHAAAQPLPTEHTHATGVITVGIDDGDVVEVSLTEAWRDEFAPDELGSVIVQTFQQLMIDRAGAWAQNVDEAGEQEYRATPTPPVGDSLAARVHQAVEDDPDRGAALTTVLENVLGVLDDISQNIDETFSAAFRRGRTVTTTAAGGHRDVNVEVTAGGELVGVSFDDSWIRSANAATITRELNHALAQARERTTLAASHPLEGTPLARYQQYADDPDSFLRYLTGKD